MCAPLELGKFSGGLLVAILSVVKLDILEAAGYSQLCAGQDAGNEAAVHAMRTIYDDPSTEVVLLVTHSIT